MTNHQQVTRPWKQTELDRLNRTSLVRVAPARTDGTLRSSVLIGHVRLDGDVIIRSLNGIRGSWYRSAIGSGWGEVQVGDERIQVAFSADSGRDEEVDDALRARYGNDSGVSRMTSPMAREATLRVVPLA